MDSGNLQEIIEKKERRYIWLEPELRRCVAENTAVMLTLFLAACYISGIRKQNLLAFAVLFAVGLIWSVFHTYRIYLRKYKNLQQIQHYLEAYEMGNYTYHLEQGFMKEGIASQIQEQMERMGFAIEVMTGRIVEEKENTKALVTDISHQLKTPLSALKLSFELAEDKQLTAEEKIEFLIRGSREVEKLQSLLDALTNVSRMEADMIQICAKPHEIRKTLSDAVGSMYMKAFQKGIEIEWSESESFQEQLLICHDPKWTQEAFVNILDNAVKYSKCGTTIEVRMKEQVSYLVIEMEDQGIGIPKEEHNNIFKRFYRVHNKQIQGEEGSGVGLYLTRRILEEQGGSIKAAQGKSGGTVFQIVLPKMTYTL